MMIHAYQEIYLSKVKALLGDAFDYAMKNNNLAHDETYWALNKR